MIAPVFPRLASRGPIEAIRGAVKRAHPERFPRLSSRGPIDPRRT